MVISTNQKYALITGAIQQETKETKVTTTKLLPGVTATDFFHKAEIKETNIVKEGSKADPAQ